MSWLTEQYNADVYNYNTVRTTGHRILNEYKHKNKSKSSVTQVYLDTNIEIPQYKPREVSNVSADDRPLTSSSSNCCVYETVSKDLAKELHEHRHVRSKGLKK